MAISSIKNAAKGIEAQKKVALNRTNLPERVGRCFVPKNNNRRPSLPPTKRVRNQVHQSKRLNKARK
jgi:hypothetical protein